MAPIAVPISATAPSQQRIDIVYLWVDGADTQWQAKRQQAFEDWAARRGGKLARYGNVAGRYRDNGELRFNLRTLERFFPDHGHLYLITDNQVPTWLRQRPGVSIVDHSDLIPAAARPVFDSGHIESYIHRIEGLSERFFYLNDDVFFGAPVDKADWFSQPLTFALEEEMAPLLDAPSPVGDALVNAATLSKHWLSQRYPDYRHDARLFSHAPRPLLRSAMFEFEQLASELFHAVRSTTFRTWSIPPLVSDTLLRWMVHRRLARTVTLNPLLIHTGSADAQRSFAQLKAEFGRLPFFCVNDTCDDAPEQDERLKRIAATFESLLPQRSSFEHALPTEQPVHGPSLTDSA